MESYKLSFFFFSWLSKMSIILFFLVCFVLTWRPPFGSFIDLFLFALVLLEGWCILVLGVPFTEVVAGIYISKYLHFSLTLPCFTPLSSISSFTDANIIRWHFEIYFLCRWLVFFSCGNTLKIFFLYSIIYNFIMIYLWLSIFINCCT